MIYSLHPEARLDLSNATDYYIEQAGFAVAQDFVNEFDRNMAFLKTHPKLGAVWQQGKRRLVLKRFPYSVVYRLDDEKIRVLAVAHQSRNPNYWIHRD